MLIKITYVTELSVEGSNIAFVLPATVSPPLKDRALNEHTQNTTATIKVDSDNIPFGLQVSYYTFGFNLSPII